MRPHGMISFCVAQGKDGTYNFTNKKFKGWIVCVTIDHFTADTAFFVDGVKIPDEELENFHTVGDIVEYVEANFEE